MEGRKSNGKVGDEKGDTKERRKRRRKRGERIVGIRPNNSLFLSSVLV